jgi:hypothetical protein
MMTFIVYRIIMVGIDSACFFLISVAPPTRICKSGGHEVFSSQIDSS